MAAFVLQHGQRVHLAGDHQHREQGDRPVAAERGRRHARGPHRDMQHGPQQEAARLRFQQRGEFGVAFAVDLQRGALRQTVGVLGLESLVVAAVVAGSGRAGSGCAGCGRSRCGCERSSSRIASSMVFASSRWVVAQDHSMPAASSSLIG